MPDWAAMFGAAASHPATQKLTAYASVAVHGSVGRALDFAGLGSEALRLFAVDGRQRIDLAALAQAICADRAAGFTPFLVVGTAGNRGYRRHR